MTSFAFGSEISDGSIVNTAADADIDRFAYEQYRSFYISIDDLPCTLYEDDQASVILTSLDEKEITFDLTNHGPYEVEYYVDSIAVNGCMLYMPIFNYEVIEEGGDSITKRISLASKDFYDINSIERIDLGINIIEGYDCFYQFAINLTDTPSYHFDIDSIATPFYEDDNIIAYMSCKDDRMFDDFEVFYYNKSNHQLYVKFIDVAFNDVQLTTAEDNLFQSYPVFSHCYYRSNVRKDMEIVHLNMLMDEIEDKGLEPIKTISGKIWILDAITFDFFDPQEVTVKTAKHIVLDE